MLNKIRVLPVLIFVCIMMLFLRVEEILAASKEIAKQEEAKKEATAEGEKPAEKADAPKVEASGADRGLPKPAVESENAHVGEKTNDPLLFNDSELDILQSLSARRAELDERERQIEQKEGLLQVTEQRLDQKLAELKDLRAELEAGKQEMDRLTKAVDEKEKQKLVTLVRTYETMKPKEAARIFDLLEMPILLDVIGQMKEAKMAPILANMEPAKAKAVTTELANRKLGLNKDKDAKAAPAPAKDGAMPPPPAAPAQ